MAVGDEREFDDYFRKEELADLIPRLENVLERLDGDEQELAVAGEIVNYVIKQLEAMDEDTAGDSKPDASDELREDHQNNESAAASETLEPAAWDYRYSGWMEGKRVVEKEEPVNCPDKEPLVRLSDVQERVEELWQNEESLHRAFIKLRKELNAEEFTQLSEAE